MKWNYRTIAFIFYFLAFLVFFAVINFADENSSGSAGFGIVCAALICCGSFFIYKHVEKNR